MLRLAAPNRPNMEILQQAWQEARTLSPAYQEKVFAERQKENAAKVEKANRAASLAVSSAPDPSSATSEDEQMRRIFRKNHAA